MVMIKKDTKITAPTHLYITNNRSDNAYEVDIQSLRTHIDQQLTLELLGSNMPMRKVFRKWLKNNCKQVDRYEGGIPNASATQQVHNYRVDDSDWSYERMKENIGDYFNRLVHDKIMVNKKRKMLALTKNNDPALTLSSYKYHNNAGGECGVMVNYNDSIEIATPRGLTNVEMMEIIKKIQHTLKGYVLEDRATRTMSNGSEYNYSTAVAKRWVNKFWPTKDE